MARRRITPEEAELVTRTQTNGELSDWDVAAARTAITSPADFFEFIAREETTKAKLRVLPHQQLFFDFVSHSAHRRCVVFMPPGASKTFCSGILTLYLLGLCPTERGALISATQGQAAKPLLMVRDYIETSRELKLVFPDLRPSMRKGDPWTQTAITVDRPPGIRDPSLVAVGIDGALPGSRLSWVVIDDILDRENTATHDQREKVFDFLETTAFSRGDLGTSRYIVTNTAHHPDDAQHRLIKKGWPGLKVTLSGNVFLYNTEWDSPLIRPSVYGPKLVEGPYRLVGNDRLHVQGTDERDELTLWPEKYTPEVVLDLKKEFTPRRFNQLYEQQSTDKASQKCHEEWIEQCKAHGTSLVDCYKGTNYTATGVDLAVKIGEEHDFTAFVTVEFRPDGMRRLLDVEIGQWNGPDIVDKILDKAERYNSVVRVEDNAAQAYIYQFTKRKKKSCRIVPHTTGKNKAHPEYGVEGIFIEFKNGAWMIPCDRFGNFCEPVQLLMNQCTSYVPAKHTGDGLMALWFAVEQGRKIAAFSGLGAGGGRASMMAR